jgi:hypothetical protein
VRLHVTERELFTAHRQCTQGADSGVRGHCGNV